MKGDEERLHYLDEMVDELNVACERLGCDAGEDRITFLTDLAPKIDALRSALSRMILEFDFMVESGAIPDVRNDIIFTQAWEAVNALPASPPLVKAS